MCGLCLEMGGGLLSSVGLRLGSCLDMFFLVRVS